jgi:hypothetical protein
VKRSYQALEEAACLRFATLWPAVGEDGSAAVRLDLVWDGRLREAVSLPGARVAEGMEEHLSALWATQSTAQCWGPEMRAVAQKDLDSLLAIRHWYNEGGVDSVVVLPGPEAGSGDLGQAKERLLAAACEILAIWPSDRAVGSLL